MQEIRERILHHAKEFWKLPDLRELDPTVKLMLEAISVELFRLSNERNDTMVRVADRVSALLTPEVLTAATPAHAIMIAQPDNEELVLPGSASFVLVANPAQPNAGETWFTPVESVRLSPVRIAYRLDGNKLTRFVPNGSDEQFYSNDLHPDWRSVFLALEVPAQLAYTEFSLFLNSNSHNYSFQFEELLSTSQWSVNGKSIVPQRGRFYESGSSDHQISTDLLTIIKKDVKGYYSHQFVTFELNLQSYRSESIAPAGLQAFSTEIITQLPHELVWLKLELPAGITESEANDLQIHINAFPVINRRLVTIPFRQKSASRFVPLKIAEDEQLLAMESVINAQSNNTPPLSAEASIINYTVRHSGLERFDNRNARELIAYLVDLVRTETSAFAAYGYDFIASTIKEIEQRLAAIAEKTGVILPGEKENMPYLVVPPTTGSSLIISYYTTRGNGANGIPAGTSVSLTPGLKLVAGSTRLLTGTTGGRNRLEASERLTAFRYALSTNNRIVTKDDISAFCFHELGDQLESVQVEKGIEVSRLPKQGFIPVLKVNLAFKGKLPPASTAELKKNLLTKLGRRSAPDIAYSICLRDETSKSVSVL